MKSSNYKKLLSGFLASLMVFQAVPMYALTTDSENDYPNITEESQGSETVTETDRDTPETDRETEKETGNETESERETEKETEHPETGTETETESESEEPPATPPTVERPQHPEGTVPSMVVGTWADYARLFDFGTFHGKAITWRVLEVTEEGKALLITHDVLDTGLVSFEQAKNTKVDVPFETFLPQEHHVDKMASKPFWLANGQVFNGKTTHDNEAGVRLVTQVDIKSEHFNEIKYSIYVPEIRSFVFERFFHVDSTGEPESRVVAQKESADVVAPENFEILGFSPHNRLTAFNRSNLNFFEATFSSGQPTNNINIERVEVTVGAEEQLGFRHMFGGRQLYRGSDAGYTDLLGNPVDGIFTPSRNASLSDHNRQFTIRTTLTAAEVGDAATFRDRVNYRFGGINFNQWLGGVQFNSGTAGAVLVHLLEDRLADNGDGTYTLESVIQFRSPGASANATGTNVPFNGYRRLHQVTNQFPRVIRHLIGTFDLTVEEDNTVLASMPIRYMPYDDFHTWEEIEDWAEDLRDEAGTTKTINRGVGSRFVDVEITGHSGRGRPIYQIVVASDAGAVNHYLSNTRRRMTESLDTAASLRAEGSANHRLPIYVTNIHPDEFAGVDSQLVMIEQLLNQTHVQFYSADDVGVNQTAWPEDWWVTAGYFYREGGSTRTVMSVDELLEHFIFIFVPTNNPDGRHYMRRGTFDGFDTNRDAAFQIHEETRALTTQVAKWSPLAQLDLHGHVAELLIEPTTGPHNNNNEYDLLLPSMLEGAHAMGKASIAGGFNRYMIPLQNMSDGWDDAGPMYLPVFLTLFGVKGFTIEFPDVTQDSVDVSIGMVWAYSHFAMNNFDQLFRNKLDIKIRGLSGEDNPAVDVWFTDRRVATRQASEDAARASLTAMSNPLATIPAGSYQHRDLGRVPAREASPTGNFFPEYWVIPMDESLQFNKREALYTAGKFANHGVNIQELTTATTVDGTLYPAGTLVISMRTAYRSYINSMMAPAANPHMYTVMYAESAIQFPAARGFRADALWVDQNSFPADNLRNIDLAAPTGPNVVLPATQIPAGNSTYVSIRNNSVDSIAFINELLRANVPVYMLTQPGHEGFATDVVVPRSALTSQRLESKYLEVSVANEIPDEAERLERPRVGLVASHTPADSPLNGQFLAPIIASPADFAIRQMGFDYSFVRSIADLDNINVLVVYGASDVNIANGVILEADARGIPIVWTMGHRLSNTTTGGSNNLPAGTGTLNVGDAALTTMFAGRLPVGGATQTGVNFQGGTFYANFGTDTILTSHYSEHDTLYIHGARSWTAVPEDTAPLFNVRDGNVEDIFQGGFVSFAMQEAMLGRYFGFTGYTNDDTPITVFGPNILVRSHARIYWPMFGSAVFSHLAEIDALDVVTFEGNTVTFDVNNGTFAENAPRYAVTNENGRLTIALPVPTRTNYRFEGWFTAQTGGTEVTSSSFFADDTTIFARWTSTTQPEPPTTAPPTTPAPTTPSQPNRPGGGGGGGADGTGIWGPSIPQTPQTPSGTTGVTIGAPVNAKVENYGTATASATANLVEGSTSVIAIANVNIAENGTNLTQTTHNFKVTVNLNGAYVTNPYRVVAFNGGRAFTGAFDSATGEFVFEANVTGEFVIRYVDKRLALQVGSVILNNLATNTTRAMDVSPIIVGDRTLVPVRFVAEALGATVYWNPETATAIITLNGRTVTLPVGYAAPYLGMDVPAQIINERTMVPLRFVTESLGGIVKWNSETAGIEVIKY